MWVGVQVLLAELEGSEATTGQAVSSSSLLGWAPGASAGYDPVFLLPFAVLWLREGGEGDVPAWLSAGLLPLCVRCLAADDRQMRYF